MALRLPRSLPALFRSRTLGWAAGLFAAFNLFAFLVLPFLAKPFLEGKLEEALHRPVAIGSLSLNPYTLSAELAGLTVGAGNGGEIASLDRLHANLEISSLWHGGPVIRTLRLEAPRLRVSRLAPGRYDISDLLEEWSRSSDSSPARFSVSDIEVSSGLLVFEDKPAGLTHTVGDIALRLPFISDLPQDADTMVEPHFSATINGSPLVLDGQARPFSVSRESELRLDLDRVDLVRYLPYLSLRLPFALRAGSLDAELKLVFSQPAGKAANASLAGRIRIRDLEAQEAGGQPLLAWKELDIPLRQADIPRGRVHLGEVRLTGLEGRLHRDSRGRLNWQDIREVLAGPGAPSGKAAEKGPPPWSVAADRLTLAGAKLRFEDEGLPAGTIQVVDGLTAQVDNFSTAAGQKAGLKLAARVNGRGRIQADGEFQLQPLATRLDLAVEGLPLLPVQPYFTERLNLVLTRGQASAKGTLDLAETPAGFDGGFKGEITIGDLESVDRIGGADFLKWKSLFLGDIDARLKPLAVTVEQVALSDFYARVAVSPEGRLNLLHIVRPPENPASPAAPVATAAPAGEKPSIRVDRVSLQGGTVNFSDHFVRPNYTVNVTRIAGSLAGLSSAPDTTASLELRGSYGNAAPVNVRARLNPLAARAHLDLKGEIRGVDLTTLSSYSGKYAGYAIDKGKLSLYVTYRLENGQLTAQNRLFLDQLAFGDPVDSPQATSLPVKLAVALLQNSRGEIDVNLPISGSIDDPEFSLGGIIIRVVRNLIVKAVTSPFAFLGSLFGGGENLAGIDFAAGRASLGEAAKHSLEALARALRERPGLRLDITGSADAEDDREGLKRVALENAVRLEKRKELEKRGAPRDSLDAMEVAPDEYPAYLQRAYREAKIPKPRNMLGLTRELPAAEMEKLLLASQPVTEDDLRQLAAHRAEAVQAWLAEQGRVPLERLFLRAPRLRADTQETRAKAGRVEFSLH